MGTILKSIIFFSVFMFILGIILIVFIIGMYVGSPYPFIKNRYTVPNYINLLQIHIYNDSFCVDVENPSISNYASSESMIPTLDKNSNGIRIIPINYSDIGIGDMITYKVNNKSIIHRVIAYGFDEEGWFVLARGDNNNYIDKKIRWNQVKYKTIALIYSIGVLL